MAQDYLSDCLAATAGPPIIETDLNPLGTAYMNDIAYAR
jgi:hypothetical protein